MPHSTESHSGLELAGPADWLGSNRDPDVLLSVPELRVDKIGLTVKQLRADVELEARVLDLLELRVGAHVTLGEVDLDIENVSAQAMLKVKLDKVAEVVDRVMQTISDNPEIVASIVEPVARDVRAGLRDALHAVAPDDAPAAAIETARVVAHDRPRSARRAAASEHQGSGTRALRTARATPRPQERVKKRVQKKTSRDPESKTPRKVRSQEAG